MGARGRLPLGIAFLGLCRIVHGMFDRAFRRKFGLRVGRERAHPSYFSQLFVLPDVNEVMKWGKCTSMESTGILSFQAVVFLAGL